MRRFNSYNTSAFTMVELMGAVTIAMVLIFLMYSIFDKVQTVFVAGAKPGPRHGGRAHGDGFDSG